MKIDWKIWRTFTLSNWTPEVFHAVSVTRFPKIDMLESAILIPHIFLPNLAICAIFVVNTARAKLLLLLMYLYTTEINKIWLCFMFG